MDDSFSDILDDKDFGGDELFAILESLDGFSSDFPAIANNNNNDQSTSSSRLVSQKSTSSSALLDSEETDSPKSKRQKLTTTTTTTSLDPDGPQTRVSHITVERNRRKQMNEHLSVLRSLMPNFYVKRVSDDLILISQISQIHTQINQVS